jgi:thiamine pyrophosphokinase
MHGLIIGNGTPPAYALAVQEASSAGLIIAADGGGNWCMQNGLTPHLVIGDLDSFDVAAYPEVACVQDADQETNDLEKALNYALSAGCRRITVLGATGIRLDHTLKNISVMARFNPLFTELVLRDNSCWMRILSGKFSFEVVPGTVVSLFPVSGRVDGIRTAGLEFALDDESLENAVRDGSSNRAIASNVTVEHRSGILLLMVYDRLEV